MLTDHYQTHRPNVACIEAVEEVVATYETGKGEGTISGTDTTINQSERAPAPWPHYHEILLLFFHPLLKPFLDILSLHDHH